MAKLNSLLLLFPSLWITVIHGEKLSTSECAEKGFSTSLLCRSCKSLGDFKLDFLSNECKKCCEEDSDDEQQTIYSFARLEVCGWKLGRFPQIQAFVKSDRVLNHPGLKVEYVRGADPIMHMLDENKQTVETLSIEKWNTDSIDEFLSVRLRK